MFREGSLRIMHISSVISCLIEEMEGDEGDDAFLYLLDGEVIPLCCKHHFKTGKSRGNSCRGFSRVVVQKRGMPGSGGKGGR